MKITDWLKNEGSSLLIFSLGFLTCSLLVGLLLWSDIWIGCAGCEYEIPALKNDYSKRIGMIIITMNGVYSVLRINPKEYRLIGGIVDKEGRLIMANFQ